MAVKITATIVVKRSKLAAEGIVVNKDDATSRTWAARRVWAFLANALPGVDVVDGLVVTVEEVDKDGNSKGQLVGVADSDVESF